jgi:hypothetical protein
MQSGKNADGLAAFLNFSVIAFFSFKITFHNIGNPILVVDDQFVFLRPENGLHSQKPGLPDIL